MTLKIQKSYFTFSSGYKPVKYTSGKMKLNFVLLRVNQKFILL